jgi:hypothetical protein
MPRLFDEQPELRDRCFVATPIKDHRFIDKGEYLLVLTGNEPQLFCGSEQVGVMPDLPQHVRDAVHAKGCGYAVATVESVAEISGTADVIPSYSPSIFSEERAIA